MATLCRDGFAGGRVSRVVVRMLWYALMSAGCVCGVWKRVIPAARCGPGAGGVGIRGGGSGRCHSPMVANDD